MHNTTLPLLESLFSECFYSNFTGNLTAIITVIITFLFFFVFSLFHEFSYIQTSQKPTKSMRRLSGGRYVLVFLFLVGYAIGVSVAVTWGLVGVGVYILFHVVQRKVLAPPPHVSSLPSLASLSPEDTQWIRDAARRDDPLADECIAEVLEKQGGHIKGRILESVQRWSKEGSPACVQFLKETSLFFEEIDEEGIKKFKLARSVYLRQAFASSACLISILIRQYAYGDISKVLGSTGRAGKDTSRRVAETAAFLYDLIAEEDSLNPEIGMGHTALIRIRLLHARVRCFIKTLALDPHNIPVNEADLFATLLVFSEGYIDSMAKTGISLLEKECDAIRFFWKYIGKVLGVSNSLLDFMNTKEQAQQRLRELDCERFNVNEATTQLTYSLISCCSYQPNHLYMPPSVIEAFLYITLSKSLRTLLKLRLRWWLLPIILTMKIGFFGLNLCQLYVPTLKQIAIPCGRLYLLSSLIYHLKGRPVCFEFSYYHSFSQTLSCPFG